MHASRSAQTQPQQTAQTATQDLTRAGGLLTTDNESYRILDTCAGGTWTAVGCGLLAHALMLVAKPFGPRLLAIVTGYAEDAVQHVRVLVGDVIIDGNGAKDDPKRWLARFSEEEGLSGCRIRHINAGEAATTMEAAGIAWDAGSYETLQMLETKLRSARGSRRRPQRKTERTP